LFGVFYEVDSRGIHDYFIHSTAEAEAKDDDQFSSDVFDPVSDLIEIPSVLGCRPQPNSISLLFTWLARFIQMKKSNLTIALLTMPPRDR
jgi:hypothetical protein